MVIPLGNAITFYFILLTHHLIIGKPLAIKINPSFQQYQDAAEILTPYATAFRYPGELMQPTPEELQEAIIKAEDLFNFVRSLLLEKIANF